MANPLLDLASPKELATRRQVIELTAKVDDFGRLVQIAQDDLSMVSQEKYPREWRAAPVNIKLVFAFADEPGAIPSLSGDIDTTLAVVCQRCLEPFELSLSTVLKILLVARAEDAKGLDEFEIWEIEDDLIRPLDIVEEALIMALPLSAMHASSEGCRLLAEDSVVDEGGTVKPFADLRSRMKDLN